MIIAAVLVAPSSRFDNRPCGVGSGLTLSARLRSVLNT
jgi:hypothetical protein